eukprot:4656760-Pyramimonas_sp.AAC.1
MNKEVVIITQAAATQGSQCLARLRDLIGLGLGITICAPPRCRGCSLTRSISYWGPIGIRLP